MRRHIPVKRQSERLAISLGADCRTQWGQVEKVTLSNVSLHGCGVTMRRDQLQTGQNVVIRTASLLGASGVVRWVDGLKAGVEFDRPLTAWLVEHLHRQHPSGVTIIVPKERQSAPELVS